MEDNATRCVALIRLDSFHTHPVRKNHQLVSHLPVKCLIKKIKKNKSQKVTGILDKENHLLEIQIRIYHDSQSISTKRNQ